MPVSKLEPYNRPAAVRYAHQWARGRNAAYYDFENLGGDCTNFASQCVYAGTGVMNHARETGWYYYDLNSRAPAWTSVTFLYHFLTQNKGPGPCGRDVPMEEAREGDLVQLMLNKPYFQHTPVIVSLPEGPERDLDSILVAAHSLDCDSRPLSSYEIHGIRFIHIDGYRKY